MKTSNSTIYVVTHLCSAIRSFSNGHYLHHVNTLFSGLHQRTDRLLSKAQYQPNHTEINEK